jgi:hypothetical protein
MKYSPTYFLFDASRAGGDNLLKAKELNVSFISLYTGRPENDLETVVPYLFSFSLNDYFSDFIDKEGWGNAWGLWVKADIALEKMQEHFAKFLITKNEDDEELYFRFYDPRVLRIFLPTCEKNQIVEFFGPVDYFIVEGDSREEAIIFSHTNGILHQQNVPVGQVRSKGITPMVGS